MRSGNQHNPDGEQDRARHPAQLNPDGMAALVELQSVADPHDQQDRPQAAAGVDHVDLGGYPVEGDGRGHQHCLQGDEQGAGPGKLVGGVGAKDCPLTIGNSRNIINIFKKHVATNDNKLFL